MDGEQDVRPTPEDGDERVRADRTWGGEAEMRGMQITPSSNIDKQSEGKEEQEVVKTAKAACCYK